MSKRQLPVGEDVYDLPDEMRVGLSEAKYIPNYKQEQYEDDLEAEYED